jgi:hypothetical protein
MECRREIEVLAKKRPKGVPKNFKETRFMVGNNALR